jgi:DNA processing protein
MKALQLPIESKEYPARIKHILGSKAPKSLQVLGNIDLLNTIGVGFCGSRKATLKGLETAADCASQIAEHGFSVISGNAAGVDFKAHFHSLKAGGGTILVLPEGINHFKVRRSLVNAWDWNRVLVISQFGANDPWKAYRAMARNQLIVALSSAMIVIEAGESGGTLNAGEETLKLGMPLFVAEYSNMTSHAKGNAILPNKGGRALRKNRVTGKANVEEIYAVIERSNTSFMRAEQGTLF